MLAQGTNDERRADGKSKNTRHCGTVPAAVCMLMPLIHCESFVSISDEKRPYSVFINTQTFKKQYVSHTKLKKVHCLGEKLASAENTPPRDE